MKARIIKTEEDYQAALERVDTLMDARPGSAEFEELELFTLLIEKYEDERYPIDFPDPVEAIKFRMEQAGLERKDMIQYLGSQSKVSEVLNHKRPLSMAMIRALSQGLGIPVEVLVQQPEHAFVSPDG
jgi:HTH-type transcriptional regulator / antitoxin HigA